MPTRTPGETPPRCDRRRRWVRVRLARRGILTLTARGRVRSLYDTAGCGQSGGRAIDFGFSPILVDRGDGSR